MGPWQTHYMLACHWVLKHSSPAIPPPPSCHPLLQPPRPEGQARASWVWGTTRPSLRVHACMHAGACDERRPPSPARGLAARTAGRPSWPDGACGLLLGPRAVPSHDFPSPTRVQHFFQDVDIKDVLDPIPDTELRTGCATKGTHVPNGGDIFGGAPPPVQGHGLAWGVLWVWSDLRRDLVLASP